MQLVLYLCGHGGDSLPCKMWCAISHLLSCCQPPVKINTAFGLAPLNSRTKQLGFACSLVCSVLPAVACGTGMEPVTQQWWWCLDVGGRGAL